MRLVVRLSKEHLGLSQLAQSEVSAWSEVLRFTFCKVFLTSIKCETKEHMWSKIRMSEFMDKWLESRADSLQTGEYPQPDPPIAELAASSVGCDPWIEEAVGRVRGVDRGRVLGFS